MFADFQLSVVLVLGDGLLAITSFTLAGAVLLGLYHVVAAAVRQYLP